MASISRQPQDMQDRHRRILTNMLKLPENRECADCHARNPTWASTNLGVFVCIRCSGLHRQVGVHITKVKSCTMDLWEPDQIAFIQKIGNAKAKLIYEAKLPAGYGKPAETEDSQLVLKWIRAKYEQKRFMADNAAAIIASSSNTTTSAEGTSGADGSASSNFRPGRARNANKAPAVASASATDYSSPGFGFGAGSPVGSSEWGTGSDANAGFATFSSPSDGTSAFGFVTTGGNDQTGGASAFGFINAGGAEQTNGSTSAFGFVDNQPHGVAETQNKASAAFGFVQPSGSDAANAFSFLTTNNKETTPATQLNFGAPSWGTTPQQQQPVSVDFFPTQPTAARDESPDFSHLPSAQRRHPTRDAGLVFDPFAPSYETASPAYGMHGGGQSPATEVLPQSPISTACDFEVQMRLMQEQIMQQQLILAEMQMKAATTVARH